MAVLSWQMRLFKPLVEVLQPGATAVWLTNKNSSQNILAVEFYKQCDLLSWENVDCPSCGLQQSKVQDAQVFTPEWAGPSTREGRSVPSSEQIIHLLPAAARPIKRSSRAYLTVTLRSGPREESMRDTPSFRGKDGSDGREWAPWANFQLVVRTTSGHRRGFPVSVRAARVGRADARSAAQRWGPPRTRRPGSSRGVWASLAPRPSSGRVSPRWWGRPCCS